MYQLKLLCNSIIKHTTNFWSSIKLIVTKPHIINKRLTGTVLIQLYECSSLENDFYQFLHKIQNSQYTNNRSLSEDIKHVQLNVIHENMNEIWSKYFEQSSTKDKSFRRCVVIINKLIPKNLKIHSPYYELCILDPCKCSATFVCFDTASNLSTNKIPYQLLFTENDNEISLNYFEKINEINDDNITTINWLKNVYFTKFEKWCNEEDVNTNSTQPYVIQSLSQINIEAYNELYNHLKEKYGTRMVEIWPEQTDPQKFVYEDIAIAAYLLILWQMERKRLQSDKLQSFVDLGCGNGLLVYILSSEGHAGYGIDLRARGIWNIYPKTTILKTETITPSDKCLYPNIDWIIGNHSDELSPWIPIISARSSESSRFFLLPCCAYEFNGKKYQRRSSKHSQYHDYLDYIQKICKICGFTSLAMDRLKIPSTKRICLIGYKRNFAIDSKIIQQFIDDETNHDNNAQWSESFIPRSTIEPIQNCTKIDKTIQQNIIEIVFQQIIAKKRYITKESNQNGIKENWNVGGIIALNDIAMQIPKHMLNAIKSECGGLQTLLRNNHQIFLVQNGHVQLRIPIKYSERLKQIEETTAVAQLQKKKQKKEFKFKEKLCWFEQNHPDNCPFIDDDCTFKHINENKS